MRKRPKPNFKARYGDNWRITSRRAKQSTNFRCCLCKNKFKVTALESHHVRYKDKKGSLKNREKVGEDVFPLCTKCHRIAHSKDFWVIDKNSPKLNNHNLLSFVKTLKANYRDIQRSFCL